MRYHNLLEMADRNAKATDELRKLMRASERTIEVSVHIRAAVAELEKAQKQLDLQVGSTYRRERPRDVTEAAA